MIERLSRRTRGSGWIADGRWWGVCGTGHAGVSPSDMILPLVIGNQSFCSYYYRYMYLFHCRSFFQMRLSPFLSLFRFSALDRSELSDWDVLPAARCKAWTLKTCPLNSRSGQIIPSPPPGSGDNLSGSTKYFRPSVVWSAPIRSSADSRGPNRP